MFFESCVHLSPILLIIFEENNTSFKASGKCKLKYAAQTKLSVALTKQSIIKSTYKLCNSIKANMNQI